MSAIQSMYDAIVGLSSIFSTTIDESPDNGQQPYIHIKDDENNSLITYHNEIRETAEELGLQVEETDDGIDIVDYNQR